ncbi:MAG: bifunctional isocitrate dehydrogenase kinase/phosphatase [Pseudomonadota bacterium]
MPSGDSVKRVTQSLVKELTLTLRDAFIDYNTRFGQITRRAKRRFEQRDWSAGRVDAVERIDLYEKCVAAAVAEVAELTGNCENPQQLLHEARESYAREISGYPDPEFFKTFFNSVTRRIFKTVGVDADVEFVAAEVRPTEYTKNQLDSRVYRNRGALRYLFDEALTDYSFGVRWRDVERTIRWMTAEIDAYTASLGPMAKVVSIELMETVFYRSTRAYLVGRIEGNDWVSPLVIALKNSDEGIFADAVILSENDVSMLFGFTRSYFHADVSRVSTAVAFIKSILPRKPIAEIYTVLGRAKQGKTERFRSLDLHMQNSTDKFIFARGDKGMVMEVFTLPSIPLVFKLIRDKFAYPKDIVRQDVLDKYRLVFHHDRAGRLIDAQEFRRLEFDRDRFEDDLLESLLTSCSQTCVLEGDKLVIKHSYLERRLAPLNLYLQEAEPDQVRAAAIDYGQAIRDLAFSNIFAGDLLLKNFGVTRHGRVIFYDYDELCLVTECNFRRLPEARDDVDEMRSGAWFYVGPDDIFPEQFVRFLGFREDAREAFLEHHGDLLDPDFWIRLKRRLETGQSPEVIPYQPKQWSEVAGPGHFVTR